jgi:hypothetical protein
LKHSKVKKQPTSNPKPSNAGPENRGRRLPKAEAHEYRLLVAPHYDQRKQRNITRVVLETVKAFASFRYDLTVEEKVSSTTIAYKILGLSAPQLSLPAAGPARFVRDYDNLNGVYDLSVQGLDGKTSTVGIRIRPNDVKVVRPSAVTSVDVVTDELHWHHE